jgi:hypothetical protein
MLTKEKANTVRHLIDAYLTGYVSGIEEIKGLVLDSAEAILNNAELLPAKQKRKYTKRKVNHIDAPAVMAAKRKPGRPKKA